MNIEIFQIPYDSGHFSKRTGRGPDYFMQNGIVTLLREAGHQVQVNRIESQAPLTTEIGTGFELNRLLAKEIQRLPPNSFPLVLAGNCNSCVGALAGLNSNDTGIIWFDAHGDYNTPETTLTGFLDGMGLAMATGQCWQKLLHQLPGYQPVPESRVIHVGSQALDPEEEQRFASAGIPVITQHCQTAATLITDFTAAVNHLQKQVKKVYLHIDLDVLETGEASANQYVLPGGLTVETVLTCLGIIKEKLTISACTIASFDPECDQDKLVLNAGISIIKAIFE